MEGIIDMTGKKKNILSPVEQTALGLSPFKDIYPPVEKTRTIVVDNFPALGKLAAMRFIEWVQCNPEGVISLPTGKTPEHFIKWVRTLLKTWDSKETKAELERWCIDPGNRPDLNNLHFIQIDEFYPINHWQHNSFIFYVNRYYLDYFGLNPEKALLIDCSQIGIPKGENLESIWPGGSVDLSLRYRKGVTLLERKQKAVLERVDQWCQEYEMKIRELGGIGFFLGGIGPDGHIGFNVRGSDHFSTTRLTATNYETQAAAATDLGGIEVARKHLVITIGLGTIAYNPQCAAIIIAAGEAKAGVVADAIQNDKNILYPATALQDLPNARFYLTRGAAKLMRERRFEALVHSEVIRDEEVERIVIDLSLQKQKPVLNLSSEDFNSEREASEVLKKNANGYQQLLATVHQRLEQRILKGSEMLHETRFFHTEPHHDDIMLGYLPYVVRLTRDPGNMHYFVCLTSGFTSVTNFFMKEKLEQLRHHIDTPEFERLLATGYFNLDNENGKNRDVWQYLDGVAANRTSMKNEGSSRRLLRDLITIFDEYDLSSIKNRINELTNYFETQYPGKKDLDFIQRLKGMCREWESECLWGYFGWNCANVLHLRLGFYTGDIFTEEPTIAKDVVPILDALKKAKPNIITVAFDPEGSGPDTHYKVLQAVTEALKRYEKLSGRSDLKVWGYRNVWYRFHPCEANIYVPVSMNMFSVMHSAFMNTFISQKDASFPSYEHDGPFSELAQNIQVDQYQKLKTCLGRKWFYEHPSALIRATRGIVFLKEMALEEFYQNSRELKTEMKTVWIGPL